jgi:hypothetical protein
MGEVMGRFLIFTSVLLTVFVARAEETAMTLDQLAIGTVEMVSCPAITEDFSKLLSRLDVLKATIKKGANCQDVNTTINTKFDGITKIRDRFLELVKKSQTDTLTDGEIKEIGNYADQVTSKVSSLIDLFTNANNCFESDADKKALTSLSGFVSEAATLLSQVAGPWGAPVAIGGQIVSGFLSGLDKILKSRAGYDFSDRTQWVAYVQNLCTYQAIKQNAEGLLHPQDRILALQNVSHKLDSNMMTIQSMCPECGTVDVVPMNQVSKSAQIQSIDMKYAYHMGSLAVRVKNAQKWVKAEISRVSTESTAYWNKDVTGKEALSVAQRDLESFLLDKEAPQFLQYQYQQAGVAFLGLQNYLYSTGKTVLHDAYNAKLIASEPAYSVWGGSWGIPSPPSSDAQAPVFKALTGTDWRLKYLGARKPLDELGFRLISARKAALDKFDTASWSYGVAYVFCDFFQQTEVYSTALQSWCSGSEAKSLAKNVAQLAVLTPEWQQAKDGLRASDWTTALSIWADQVQAAVASTPNPMR